MTADVRAAEAPRMLFLCTGNSCRSQMAEAIFRSFDPSLEVYSAGTKPAAEVHPLAVRVMREIGIDISGRSPKSVDRFLSLSFDYVVTLCDDAKENCPLFAGAVKHRVHIGFEDPAEATGEEARVLATFRRVRDDIRARLHDFYRERIHL